MNQPTYTRLFTVLLLAILTPLVMLAQHEQHQEQEMPAKKDTTAPKKMDHDSMGHGSMHGSHAFSRNLPMNRNGSGTAWMPDNSPMYMYMAGKKAMWMFHGNIFLRYTNTDLFNAGNRGRGRLSAPNWAMAMVNKPIGKKGLLTAKLMMSLDRVTEGGGGYPLLFQSGESWRGQALVDRQHPHDLFSELSVGYTHAFTRDIDAFVYLGYPGEPAISAPAFMHRISAMNNPDAPLSHHWQDATHITFGVTTLGFRYKTLKAEGSVFTGREPDEERYGFDEPRFNSYSYRLSWNPVSSLAFQFSQAFLESPEQLHASEDVTRTTASALFSRPLAASRQLDASLIWGMNRAEEPGGSHGRSEHSVLLESNLQMRKSAFYQRYEFVQKSDEELALDSAGGHDLHPVHAFTAGYNHVLFRTGIFELLGGGQLTLNFVPGELRDLYGKLPLGGQIYLQFRPSRMMMKRTK